ncbi:MAG TPA: zf-HC2 domain-containing protein [Candidatus Limnocylindria bacterium]|nr:zf-HC2 domain-containing protein [Candidatus Limnocylindria bacterium]
MRRVVARLMRMMGKRTCEDVVAILHDYFEGRLDPALAAIVGHHLEDCPDCEAFARTYGTVVRLTGELPVDDIPAEVCDRVRRALRERYGR